ncbi:hypothetical protein DBR06_SOUSAS110255 [Sousa chinensis]|uniref:Uncharacterized protein n=2 Tax=Odontoceti TaxID=9722 RepID=A0A484GSC0_SOUCH|nr:hypothetical protein DBR06_SOUSAS110255 [Sousa chinensis]
MNHREDLQGYLLNLFLQSQSPSLKRPLQRRERRYPKRKRGKLMLARMGIILQKMEMPKQTRHRKLKVLEMPSEVCIFDNCVLLVTVQFEILFFIKFYKNAEFCFTFFFLSYVVSIQNTSLLFFGGRAHVTNRLSLKLD